MRFFLNAATPQSLARSLNRGLYLLDKGNMAPRGIEESNLKLPWLNYEPEVSAGGSMTIADLNIIVARYLLLDTVCFLNLRLRMTTGGTADNDIIVTLPEFPNVLDDSLNFNAFSVITESIAGYAFIASGMPKTIQVRRYDNGNHTLASNYDIYITGFYELEA